MTESALAYRWSRDGFLRAWEAGAFDARVELVEGEVWPVVIGPWHGDMTFHIARLLPGEGVRISSSTLPSGDSLPDPDCWVRRKEAEPVDSIGERLATWRPEDVLLVIEVADETAAADLTVKARLYAAAGYRAYWVITRDAVYAHAVPGADGYERRDEHRAGTLVPVPYAPADIPVDDLLDIS